MLEWKECGDEITKNKIYCGRRYADSKNHTFDWGYGGLISTLDELKGRKFVHAGVGMNLDEAAAPAYLDTPTARVALISMTSLSVTRKFPRRMEHG